MNHQLPNEFPPYPPTRGRGASRNAPIYHSLCVGDGHPIGFYCDLNRHLVPPPGTAPPARYPTELPSNPPISGSSEITQKSSEPVPCSSTSCKQGRDDQAAESDELRAGSPPEKRLKLSSEFEEEELTPPYFTRSLCSTPELVIDESRQPDESDDGLSSAGECSTPQGGEGSEPYKNQFESITPPNEPASSPPPMVVTSHKKFHYKSWAAANSDQENSNQAVVVFENPNGTVDQLTLSPYINEAQALGRLHLVGAEEAQREMDKFSAIIRSGDMFRQQQVEKMREAQREKQAAIAIAAFREATEDVVEAKSNDSTETMSDLYRDIEELEFVDDQKSPTGEAEGGDMNAVEELMDYAVDI